MRTRLFLCVLCFFAVHALASDRIDLRTNWLLQSSTLVKDPPELISSPTYTPKNWLPTTLPTTVLSALVKNNLYPSPWIGLNAYRIPDASEAFNQKHNLSQFSHLPDKRNPWLDPYYFRTQFALPPYYANQRIWLHFNCINYRADVYLNGHLIADHRTMAAMFQRFAFDVTDHARPGQNTLAVRIHPVDHPGTPDQQLKVFGPERRYTNKDIMRDVTEIMTIGYDCFPTIPDRNMGILQDVYVETTGPVVIRDPFIVTDLPTLDRATLKISATLHNASNQPQKGALNGEIKNTDLRFQMPFELAPGQTKEIAFDPPPVLDNPRLWWPHNKGPQNRYKLSLSFNINNTPSHSLDTPFAVRKLTTEHYERDGWHGRRIYINNQRIFARGGYIQPEATFNWDPQRIESELRYYANANLNLIYFEDIPNPPDEFLDLCDQLGLMFGNCFYSCFWLRTDTKYPDDLPLLEKCTVDLVKRYRNHPSLIMYMAMNEADTRQDVYEMWRKHVTTLDGTRFFIPSAYFPDDRKDTPEYFKKDLPAGMTDLGEKTYTWVEPSQYYKWVRNNRNWMFQMENGSASLPPISSLSKFIPDLGSNNSDSALFPLNETFAHHGANHYYKDYDQALRRIYGPPTSLADYCWKGHLLTADQHRAMFEAVHHRMWDLTSGLTQWKINSAFPDIQWQIFDYYLKPMPSYFYIKKACQPLHIQLGLLEPTVTLINNHLTDQRNLTARARVFDFSMKLLFDKTEKTDIPPNSYKDLFTLPAGLPLTDVYFVQLDLTDRNGLPIADNFYWLARDKSTDLQKLLSLPLVALTSEHTVQRNGNQMALRANVFNPSNILALLVQLTVTKGAQGDEVLPVLWSDNYFCLPPHESKVVTATFATSDLGNSIPALELGGVNVLTPYRCTDLQLSKTRAAAGQPVTVTATIANTFLDGSRVQFVISNAPPPLLRFAHARGNNQDKVSATINCKTGTHQISVGSKTATLRVD
ncbi:MAG: hypothetical protein NTU53_03920 [Planctomycetota bacterium]|nr:hypothetical protein [Planctomycetota bacterium]